MKQLKLMSLIVMLTALTIYGADNEIYVDQSGATANIDLEQLGSGNIIGGLNSVAGTLTALDLDGITMTLDINQIGDTNKFLGDILGDSVTGFFEFDGDSNISTGGIGARYLGIGSSMQYREDSVSVSLRMVSVATGEILIEVMSQKIIYSYGQSQDVFKFIEMGTELVEVEIGSASNESTTLALMKAIEGAVLQLINIGYERGYWKYEKIN